MDFLTIDRFEGPFAVCEMPDGSIENIARSELPQEAREGATLRRSGNNWALAPEEEDARRERIERKMNALFED